MAQAIPHHYHYQRPSELGAGGLRLAASSPSADGASRFFEGRLEHPEETAKLLIGLMSVVQARYHIPSAMLAKMAEQWDPVVTAGAERLRFEGFSACCGVYGRVDLHPGSVRDETFGKGTTNVDFNPPMLAALARVGPTDPVHLAVGREGVELQTQTGSVVERKVELPVRWLKSFVEVQASQRRMTLAFEVPGPVAQRFLRSLPRVKTNRRETWVVPSAGGIRLSQVEPRGTALRVGGLERLRLLERLAPRARRLAAFSDERTGASGWVLDFGDARFQLVISPEVWRGFSGEGQALEDLAADDWRSVIAQVRAQLAWRSVIDVDEVARLAGIEPSATERALSVLGSRGLVGFDLDAARWFHRELPFDLSAVDSLHPRLRSARKLVGARGVKIRSQRDTRVEAWVRGSGVEHRVRLEGEAWRCSCPWFGKHGTDRGPCKHVLAVQMTVGQE